MEPLQGPFKEPSSNYQGRTLGVPYLGVLIIRILLVRVQGPFKEPLSPPEAKAAEEKDGLETSLGSPTRGFCSLEWGLGL